MRIAATLGCPIGEAKERISAGEFNLWVAYFNKQDELKWQKGAEPMHWYMAQLTGTVANLLSKNPVPAERFLLELNTDKAPKNNIAQHKSILLGMFGINEDDH